MSELQGIARFRINEGKLDELKRLSAQARDVVRTKDTGTLQYEIYFNDDESECIVLERFRDSEALIEHTANLGDLVEAILATAPWFTANSAVNRAQNSEGTWPAWTSRFSSRHTSRCRSLSTFPRGSLAQHLTESGAPFPFAAQLCLEAVYLLL